VNPINGSAGQASCQPHCGDGYCQPNSLLKDGKMGAENCVNCPEDCAGGMRPVCDPATNKPLGQDIGCDQTISPGDSPTAATNCSQCCGGPFGDVYYRHRTCASNCQWNDWSACDGSDCILGDTCFPDGTCHGGFFSNFL
jgi:hypothetical protein